MGEPSLLCVTSFIMGPFLFLTLQLYVIDATIDAKSFYSYYLKASFIDQLTKLLYLLYITKIYDFMLSS